MHHDDNLNHFDTNGEERLKIYSQVTEKLGGNLSIQNISKYIIESWKYNEYNENTNM